ncbi:glycosyltransferase family 2 protein [uncultured Bacteroides sp.]|uniref:glycosyltransferase family 2 protein n=1 Tax=uncultured Bacteroides sp. TaxID=162156 RepID=UPI0025FD4229|nr:glycosyltransferase family 2 protein [uncultured Bacteroides sp.]
MKAIVSIITVNYNGFVDTCEMIESFHKYETYPYEIIVVDNGSHMPEGEKLQKKFPDIKVKQNTNTGFAGGNNAGLAMAKGQYLLFINNDTLIKAPILDTLIKRLETDKKNGGVSPMLKYAYAPDILQFAGFTPFSYITLRNSAIGFNDKDQPCYHKACETASLHGASMMISREVLQKAGPMSEDYFLFYEEFDWSARILHAGYRLWYEPAAVVYHKEGTTAKKGSLLREFYLSRARILFARKNFTGIRKLLSCLYIFSIAAPKKAILYLLHGELSLAKAVLSGTYNGITSKYKKS